MTDDNQNLDQLVEEPSGGGWGRVLAWLVVFALLAVVAIQLNKAQKGSVAMGEKAPEFTLTTFDGQVIGPEEMAGKVVVVNFWASWCKPCEQEAAELQEAWTMYEDRGDVLFLGVDWTDTNNEAMAYLEKFEITYTNGPDLGTKISQAFRTTGVPETYIIDKEGNLAYVKIGPFLSLFEITSAIDPLLD